MRPVSSVPFVLCLVVLLAIPILPIGPPSASADDSKPHAKVIAFESKLNDIQPLLGEPPETVTMKSGLVTLAPGKSVGKHSTAQHEELLVILAGRGEMIFKDGSKLAIEANQALYCPPDTEHDVTNTGGETLRYVYVVANAK